MTPAERQQRRRQGIKASMMTRAERTDLAVLIRKREKLMKTSAKQRSAELMADFEQKIASIYAFDSDETWKAAHDAAEQAVKAAEAEIAQRCGELGIPPEFAPGISMGWRGRGQNATAERRAELRRVAKTQIDVMEAKAKTEIERISLESQTAVISDGLTSETAQEFLANMPTAEALMPLLDIKQIKVLTHKD